MEYYCVARNKPIRREITKPQTATVISLWFWGLLAYPELYCDWLVHNQHSWNFLGVHGFLSLTVNAQEPCINFWFSLKLLLMQNLIFFLLIKIKQAIHVNINYREILYSPQKEEGNTRKWKCGMKDFVCLMHRKLCPLIVHVLLYCCCLSFPVSTTSMPLKVKKTNENNHTTYGSLVIALAFGILFFLAVLVLIGRPWWYSFHRPRYSKVDYLMNGLWKILVLVGESYYLVGRQIGVDLIVADIYYVLLREM